MRILTIDTSAVASAALLSFDAADDSAAARVETEFATADTRSHAEVLAPGVRSLFADPLTEGPAVDAIVVGVGPGPFTGLRSGIAMARTLAFT
ncbi:tRNA (adenosine(37)-N6)-threonylcarbamoyltransferase complex dimerization subunit type 1 TsaB, partial [Arthrobacter sp.]